MPAPSKKPPVYIRPITQHAISATTGTIRSAIVPRAETGASSAPSYGRASTVYRSPFRRALSSCVFIMP